MDRHGRVVRGNPQGSERVAGREAHVLTVQPRMRTGSATGSGPTSDTGLLLRADVLDDRNEVLGDFGLSRGRDRRAAAARRLTRRCGSSTGTALTRPALAATGLNTKAGRCASLCRASAWSVAPSGLRSPSSNSEKSVAPSRAGAAGHLLRRADLRVGLSSNRSTRSAISVPCSPLSARRRP
ncbi:sigma-E factor regulatory protein RseB domain-containing protein [Piscinibacter sp.]|uniref:sigma-E factor regulatory protein RseB domain-containing protein n=1 Tax=Piscinibacter sp. TaxID=1903157 RepID=UPI003418ECBC